MRPPPPPPPSSFSSGASRVRLLQTLDSPPAAASPIHATHEQRPPPFHLTLPGGVTPTPPIRPRRAPPTDLFQSNSNNNGISGGAYRDSRSAATRAKDDAKLIFGTVFSLRNMVRKLGGDDDAFISYRTAQYKLHYYETPSSLRFAMLTEPGALSMRNVLHQIYINLWVEYVEHKNGEGVRNEMFDMGLDKFVRGLM
ncbi:hypothetical protein PG994_010089 [Apiospora phragmitis]|uniref:Trafficking protein particle complex subunit n=1 Tax=Apiospora phragmitis TaxID=2905665 RepID=A0ABR1TNX7_9PEZI